MILMVIVEKRLLHACSLNYIHQNDNEYTTTLIVLITPLKVNITLFLPSTVNFPPPCKQILANDFHRVEQFEL